MSSRPSE